MFAHAERLKVEEHVYFDLKFGATPSTTCRPHVGGRAFASCERKRMRILELRPIDEPGGGHRAIAAFDLELTPECRLYGLRLLRMRDGRLLTFAPQSGYRRVATFATPLATEITRLAIDQLRALTADDRYHAA